MRVPRQRIPPPALAVAAAVVFGLVALWPEHRDVWYLNDSAVHRSMVAWAAARIREGHLPFDGWYPYLSLGASRFHHYQSLPHILTGLASIVFGLATYSWSLYLLLALWPISVYWGGRLLGLGRWPSACAALVSPLLVSRPGLGYEWSSYVWRGSGTWAQLWGMWTLPLAWGLGWRAVATGKRLWLAVLVIALTVVFHLLTGYLALLSLGVFVIAVPKEIPRRLGRAVVVGLGTLAVSAWMLVPLITGAKWTINDEFSRGTYFYDSFGARKIMGWLLTGRIFDDGRLPVISLLVAIGLVMSVWAFRRMEQARVLLLLGLLSLLLFFGRPTLGPVLKLLPGGGDLFLRRYIMGVHLAGIYLAGLGLTWLGSRLVALVSSSAPARRAAVAIAVAAVVLAPAVVERIDYISKDWTWIPQQIQVDNSDGAGFAALVQRAQGLGPGRIFSELRTGRPHYLIGSVPAFAALLDLQADAIGFTRPTWSLASGAEERFDIANPNDPALFGVRYVIFPSGWVPPKGAVRIASSGRHVLYEMPHVGYAALVDTIAPIRVDRDDIGSQMGSFLDSDLPARGLIPTLAFGKQPAAAPTLPSGTEPVRLPGVILRQYATPADGVYGAQVRATRSSVVMFRVSYDPGFRATVDGQPAPIQMLAPAFVGVPVTPGTHQVSIVYRSYPWYPPLFALGALALIGLWVWDRRRAVS